MVQFNLLPDIKLQYVKARRTKHLITFVSIIVGGTALGVMLFSLLFVKVIQKQSLDHINTDIKKYSKTLKDTKDLNTILTVQNQLSTLTTLHENKPVASRVFIYLSQVTPAAVSLNQLNVDFTAHTLTVGGSAQSLDSIKLYTDVLKNTRYTVKSETAATKAFSNVVLASFAVSDKGPTYSITMSYDQNIFDVKQDVTLTVPAGSSGNQAAVFGTGSN